MKFNFVKAYVTGIYIGLIPFAPGTFGSLLAFPLCTSLIMLCAKLNIRFNIPGMDKIQQELLTIAIVIIAFCIFLFVSGKYLVDEYIKVVGREDPKEVVIDEVAGQMLTIILIFPTAIFAHNSYLVEKYSPWMLDIFFLFILPFILFRVFDIMKPWPINYVDKNIKGGFGVMFDDFLAAIFAAVMCYAVTFIIIGDYAGAK